MLISSIWSWFYFPMVITSGKKKIFLVIDFYMTLETSVDGA